MQLKPDGHMASLCVVLTSIDVGATSFGAVYLLGSDSCKSQEMPQGISNMASHTMLETTT